MKRRTKILLLLVIALILGFIFLLPHGGYRRAVAEYKKQLLARGEKLTIAELVPPTSAEGLEAARNLPPAPSVPMFWYDLSAMRMVAPGVAKVGFATVTPQQLGEYDKNIRQVADLRKSLNVAELDFNLDYTMMAHWQTPASLPSILSGFKSRELLAVSTAMLALHNKDATEASLDLNAAVDLVRLCPHEAAMIFDVVRAGNARIAVSATWEALQSDVLSNAQLAALQEKWQQTDFFGPFEATLAMEMACRIETLAWFRNNYNSNALAPVSWHVQSFVISSNTLVPLITNTGAGGWFGGSKKKLGAFYDRYPRYWRWRSSWSYDEEHFALQMVEAMLTTLHRARTTGALLPALREFDEQSARIIQLHPGGAKFFLVFRPDDVTNMSNYLAKIVRAENSRRLAITAIALKRFHLRHDAYPPALNELVPAFLPQVPDDLMDGQPLRYRLKPDGDFLLYAVGLDGKDDGGDPTPTDSLNDWEGARDTVWPRAATPKEVEDSLKHPYNTPTPTPRRP